MNSVDYVRANDLYNQYNEFYNSLSYDDAHTIKQTELRIAELEKIIDEILK